ncbi:MAG: hypothetical protein ACD_63C00256G0002 [uncultured bacterium]|nr:MAG: hypothetical protein ACD_63C00256G0002 [uncultured bacterium]
MENRVYNFFEKFPRWLRVVIIAVVILIVIVLVLKYGGWFDKIAYSYVGRGNKYLENREYSKAMKEYAFAVALEDLDGKAAFEAHVRRGQIFYSKRNFNEAVREFEAAYKLYKKRKEIQILLGKAYLAVGRVDDAEKVLSKALEQDSGDAEILVNLGKTIFKKFEELERGEDYLKEAIKINGENQEAYFYLALIYLDHDENLALEKISRALDLPGDLSDEARSVHERIMEMQNDKLRGREEKEARAYERVLIGWTYAGVSEYDAALRKTAEALELVSEYRDAWILKAWIEIEKEDFAMAEDSLNKAYRCDSTHGQTQYLYGRLHFKMGEFDKAHDDFEKALNLGYDHVSLRRDFAKLFSRTGDLKEAEKQLLKAHAVDSKNLEVGSMLIWLYVENLHKTQDAVKLAQQLDKIHKTSRTRALLALAYFYEGDEKAAEVAAGEALERDAEEALAYYVEGLVDGDREKFEKAVDLDFEGEVAKRAGELF